MSNSHGTAGIKILQLDGWSKGTGYILLNCDLSMIVSQTTLKRFSEWWRSWLFTGVQEHSGQSAAIVRVEVTQVIPWTDFNIVFVKLYLPYAFMMTKSLCRWRFEVLQRTSYGHVWFFCNSELFCAPRFIAMWSQSPMALCSLVSSFSCNLRELPTAPASFNSWTVG